MAAKKKAEAAPKAETPKKEKPAEVKAEPKKPACNHLWLGTADGVECRFCGKTLTADEFADYCKKGGK